MVLTRRKFVLAGASTLLATPGLLSAATTSYPGIDPDLMDRARQALQRNRRFLAATDLFAIADYSQPSRAERFYLVRTDSGEISCYQVSHGRGSDPDHCGYLNHFSNAPGSAASSAGAYVTGDFYEGRYGRSLRLKGLDPSNSNAEARGIVIHSAPYAEPEVAERMGKLGRSEGCFAMSRLSLFLVIRQLGTGRLLYSDKV